MPGEPRGVVIGVGNEYRRDDGLGPAVVARLSGFDLPGVTVAVSDGEPSSMLHLWTGAELAVVVDAVRVDDGVPGRLHELVTGELAEVPPETGTSHAIGLGTTVELARALGRMPGRLVVYAVEGTDFGYGPGLSAEVAAAVEPVAERVRQAVAALPRPE